MNEIVERRMDAYYYGFTHTHVPAIDKVLGAVACAGKAFHHTDDWADECRSQYDDHAGAAPVDWIQNAAQEAADTITRLQAEVERLRSMTVVQESLIRSKEVEVERLRAALKEISEMTWSPTDRETYQDLFASAQDVAETALQPPAQEVSI